MSDQNIEVCVRYTFRGHVQGVGFRWTAVDCSRDLNLKGYVKNMQDGAVELKVQGPPENISSLIDELSSRMANNIRSVSKVSEKPHLTQKFCVTY